MPRTALISSVLSLLLAAFAFVQDASGQENSKWWPGEVDAALAQAGDNRTRLTKALNEVPANQRQGMSFLITNMPKKDLQSLSAEFLLENVNLAYRAKNELPWGKSIPDDIFLNYVLPYANVNEDRDPWRKEFFEMCMPLVKDCKTAAEAAHVLNSKIFSILKVRFSTKRNKPHQSPKETISIGMASCTGLSIILSDACRSVGIPARLVGTPQWVPVQGNHTWVEVWDKKWHFTGACEPHPKGLDHAWFTGRAQQAKKDSKYQAIYAASFRKTGVTFPLVWSMTDQSVNALNVTDRYAKPKQEIKSTGPLESKLDAKQQQSVIDAAKAFFAAEAKKQADWKFDEPLNKLLLKQEKEIRQLVWNAYRKAPMHEDLKKDHNGNQVRYDKHLSPYTIKTVGERPKHGWPLFIAMHGGGGVPKKINDSQWRVMQKYYRDQDSVTGYKYLALRAPNDTWNGFYDQYVPPLVTNLIRQMLLFGDVDSNKVFLMGYSHGGYGAFYIGPKLPDRFAAIHASAAAPTDGTISPKCLRNTRFTFMIGERDTAYGRKMRCEKFNESVLALKKDRQDCFPVEMEFKKGHGHTGLPDRDKIKEMYSYTRNPVPHHLTWDLTDDVIGNFFWLHTPAPVRGKSIEAIVKDNTVEITSNLDEYEVYLDGRLVNFDAPVTVTINGKTTTVQAAPQFSTLCRTMLERADPDLAFTYRVPIE